jgi:hypothetical protein
LLDHQVPLAAATLQRLKVHGRIADNFADAPIEIVRWPARDRRPADPNTGDQGGATGGIFSYCWNREVLHAGNRPVGDSYPLRWSRDPREASRTAAIPDRSQGLTWRANGARPVGDAAL